MGLDLMDSTIEPKASWESNSRYKLAPVVQNRETGPISCWEPSLGPIIKKSRTANTLYSETQIRELAIVPNVGSNIYWAGGNADLTTIYPTYLLGERFR